MSQDTKTARGHSAAVLCAAAMLFLLASPAAAKPTRCHLTYEVEGWSIIYFLNKGPRSSVRGKFRKEWKGILKRYFTTLKKEWGDPEEDEDEEEEESPDVGDK